MRVRWLQRALEGAAEAAKYIAVDRPRAAARWREGLIDTAERIAAFPLSGRIVPEAEKPELREVIYADYRIIYLLGEPPVVVAVHHCRRRLSKRKLRGWIREAAEPM
jgi:plasmid stabilization system protein ParE